MICIFIFGWRGSALIRTLLPDTGFCCISNQNLTPQGFVQGSDTLRIRVQSCRQHAKSRIIVEELGEKT